MRKLIAIGLLAALSLPSFAARNFVEEIPFYNEFINWGGQVWGNADPAKAIHKTIVCREETTSPYFIYGWFSTLNIKGNPHDTFKLKEGFPATVIFYDVQPIEAGATMSIAIEDMYDLKKSGFTVSCIYQ